MDRPPRRPPVDHGQSAIDADLTFESQGVYTLGAELEFQLIDPSSGELMSRAAVVIGALQEHPTLVPRVHFELMLNTLELVTGRSAEGALPQTVAEVRADMAATLDTVMALAEAAGMRMVLAGSHPFSDPRQQAYNPSARIQTMVHEVGKPARDLQTFGLHVHVGVPDGDAAIRAMNSLNRHLPHLLALSASSPFWDGEDTSMESFRSPIFESMPLTGPPPGMSSWSDYQHHYWTLTRERAIGDGGRDNPWAGNKDIHWDVRPSPRFGTIEMRVCDAPQNLTEMASLVALTQCLVAEAVESPAHARLGDFWVRHNKACAAARGLDAVIHRPGARGGIDLRGDVVATVARLMPLARRLGCAAELDGVLAIVRDGPGASRQRRVYASHAPATTDGWRLDRGAARQVVDSLWRELSASLERASA